MVIGVMGFRASGFKVRGPSSQVVGQILQSDWFLALSFTHPAYSEGSGCKV